MSDNLMDRVLNQYPPPKDLDKDDDVDSTVQAHRSPKRMAIERRIDLHGKTIDEARVELDTFIAACVAEEVRKILIIHGKGTTEGSDGTMRRFVRRYLEENQFIGTTGIPAERDGGSGAVWAIVRQRSR